MKRALSKFLSVIIAMAMAICPLYMLSAVAAENSDFEGDNETVDSGLNLNTEAHLIRPGETFSFDTYFAESVNGNTAILRYSFNPEFFECLGFTPAEGVTTISVDISDGEVKAFVMVPNYEMSSLGELTLRAREDAPHSDACYTMSLLAEHVVKNAEGAKETVTTGLSTVFVTLVSLKGDTNGDNLIDLFDLSNIIDWYGFDTNNPDWYEKYVFFDFNNDGEIDISDISYVAAHLGDKGKGDPDAELESINLASLPEKLAYIVGEQLDLSGMVVQAVYTDGSVVDVTDLASTDPTNGAVMDTAGTIPVSVSFEDQTAGFDILVSEPEQLPEITEFTVRPASIIANLAAYVHVEYAGNNLDDRQVYVSMLDAEGNAIGEPALGVNAKATLYIPVAPAEAGDYDIVATVDGVVLASGSIEVVPYNDSFWDMLTEPDEQGYIVLKFNSDIAIGDGNISNKVSLNGKNIVASLGADKRSIITSVKYDELADGVNTFSVKNVKLTELFPSFTFTFTAEVIK